MLQATSDIIGRNLWVSSSGVQSPINLLVLPTSSRTDEVPEQSTPARAALGVHEPRLHRGPAFEFECKTGSLSLVTVTCLPILTW